jgi:hypothetical protein
VIYDLLFKASVETTLTIAADPNHLGARIGFMSVLHTWGSALTHHPHVHIGSSSVCRPYGRETTSAPPAARPCPNVLGAPSTTVATAVRRTHRRGLSRSDLVPWHR